MGERAASAEGSRADAGTHLGGPAGRAERPSSSTTKAPSAGAGGAITADADMRYAAERRAPARVAVALTVLGALIHAAGVVTRALGAGRVPWGNMYEFLTTGAFVAVAVFLLVLVRRDLRFLGTFVVGLAIIMLVAASVAYWTPVGHLVPALQSYWLIIHVSIAVLSSALFTLTFAMSALQLVQSHRQKTAAAGGADKLGFMRLVPSALSLENLSYRINAIAFIGWTFTLMFGAIWAEKAWGRFWGLGHQRGVDLRDLGCLRRIPPRARNAWLDRHAGCLAFDRGLPLRGFQLHHREPVLQRAPLVFRPLSRDSGRSPRARGHL
jgi:ABC-type transport system involved in cytochrome c biogenesis permease subunit